MKKLKINLTNQELLNASNVSGLIALKEAIWNGFDAEAERIDIEFIKTDLGAVNTICISDNGHGISYENFQAEFCMYGKSNKVGKVFTPDKKRFYHGKEGKGRFRLFSLGEQLQWSTTYYDRDINKNLTYSISIDTDQIDDFIFSDPIETTNKVGTKVVIKKLNDKKVNELLRKNIEFEIVREMAPTLKAYNDIEIYFDSKQIDYKEFLYGEEVGTWEIILAEKEQPIDYVFLVWKKETYHDLFLCDNASKTPLSMESTGTKSTIVSHSCFLYADYFKELFNHDGLDAMNSELNIIKSQIKKKLDEIAWSFHRKMIEEKIIEVKNGDFYPFETEPKDQYEILERAVFDSALALVLDKNPSFDKMTKTLKRLNLKLLKTIVEQGQDIEATLTNILGLNKNDISDLNIILEKTSFQSIIRKYKTVMHYLSFLKFLEQITYEKEIKSHLKERLGLQKIIRDELWIFGDEYSLIGDDESIKTVIENEVLKIRKSSPPAFDLTEEQFNAIQKELEDNPDNYSKHIPDMFLIRKDSQKNKALIIELKAPKVSLDFSHLKQLKRYAENISKILNLAIPEHEQIQLDFILISSDVSKELLGLINDQGIHTDSTLPKNVTIYIYNWTTLLQKRGKELEKVKKDLDITLKGDEYKSFFEKYHEPLNK